MQHENTEIWHCVSFNFQLPGILFLPFNPSPYLSYRSIATTYRNHLDHYSTPINLNYLFSIGALLLIAHLLQLLTGFLLTFHYSNDIATVRISLSTISLEAYSGYVIRYSHSSGASLVMALTTLHILKALHYQTVQYNPAMYTSGVTIYLISMGLCFLGYVLVWGSMSFWGSTVITNLLASIPNAIVWLCGGFYVSNPTLHRFFVLHILLAIVLLLLITIHFSYLHVSGSHNSH
jgi:ubiquinol-cytochrome c reductase cytochrome b subunit